MPRALTIVDLTDRAGEPRVRDLLLADSLGMKDPHDIRRLISRYSEELESYGEVSGTLPETSAKGGRPGRAYWLNEAQALLVCMFARTPQAAAVRKQVIEVFTAYRAGRLAPPTDLTALEARLAKAEAAIAARPGGSIASALADIIEAQASLSGDGLHLGPSDLSLCVVHLRGGATPTIAAPKTENVTDLVRRYIERAGPAGIRRSGLRKTVPPRLKAWQIDNALEPLIRSGDVLVSYEQNPFGGPMARIYRMK